MTKRDWLLVGIVVAVLAALFTFRDEAQAALIVARGANGGCSWQEATDGFRLVQRQEDLARTYAKSSRLLTEDDKGLKHWRTPRGDYWAVSSDPKAVTFNIAEQERGIYSIGGHGVKPGDIVLDCGANVGVYSRVALQAGARKVIAIEPEPRTAECLRRNLAKEITDGRAVIVSKGVWDREDILELQVDEANPLDSSFVGVRGDGRHKVRVPLTTIDNLAADLGLERVDYIKMDIEGAERNAVSGAKETIRKFHPRLAISVYHLPDDPGVIDDRVRDSWPGYRRFAGACIAGRDRALPEVHFYE